MITSESGEEVASFHIGEKTEALIRVCAEAEGLEVDEWIRAVIAQAVYGA